MTEAKLSRQQQRARFRALGEVALRRVVKLPRGIRRIGARAYATAAWREVRGLKPPVPRHRYVNFVINPGVRDFVIKVGMLK